MADGDRHAANQWESDLEAELRSLAPVILELERAEAELTPESRLRLRSVISDGLPAARPVRPRTRGWPLRPLAVSALTALAAVLILLLVFQPRPHRAPTFPAPYPSVGDLLFNYPSLTTTVRHVTATASLVHPAPGLPFAGHLTLRAPRLPVGTSTLMAYQLAAPLDWRPMAERLDIHARFHRVRSAGTTWVVAADQKPLHSLAVAMQTGELIYHDRRNYVLPRSEHALNRSATVEAARHWLTSLGWPGKLMPLRSFGSVDGLPKVRRVVLGWVGVPRAATQAATLWVTPDGSIVEALVWPPVARAGRIPARSVSTAWAEVRHGTIPLAVLGVSPLSRSHGAGVARRTQVVSVLSSGTARRLFLVPTYRFAGIAHLKGGAGVHHWFALAPSAAR